MKFLALLIVATLAAWGCSSQEPAATTDSSSDTFTPDLASVAFDTPPEPVTSPRPDYPEEARRALAAGTAHIEVLVDASGAVRETRVVHSSDHPVLDQAAEDAARRWTFTPATKGDVPVSAKIVIPFQFKLG